MVKKSPTEHTGRKTKKMPARRAYCSRRMAWAQGIFPFKWSFFTNWRGVTLSLGELDGVTEAPQSKFLVTLDWRPFGFSIFWYDKHIVWIGDWEWKKSLRNPNTKSR